MCDFRQQTLWFRLSDHRSWHQDVTPKNILVISRPGESPYDSYFKIADLGISHFQKYMGLQRGATDRDAFGTQAYGQ